MTITLDIYAEHITWMMGTGFWNKISFAVSSMFDYVSQTELVKQTLFWSTLLKFKNLIGLKKFCHKKNLQYAGIN